ncbi:uncharacterized protein LOC121038989 isoform X4 [Herpailurus yagouaroundi]|uniref:uncharacterized protein LOC121038989 isoform X4 n=1 Tax=Herpailurus yagouaroundi TaxID=1608482 RepID=UPI001AD6A76D|nr:uncharacterized protein LOC121038989 isoform X4 [Puma yagouaroundi]
MGGRSLRARDKTSAARAEVDGESGGGIFPDTPPSPLFSAPAESHQWRLPEQGGGVESRPGRSPFGAIKHLVTQPQKCPLRSARPQAVVAAAFCALRPRGRKGGRGGRLSEQPGGGRTAGLCGKRALEAGWLPRWQKRRAGGQEAEVPPPPRPVESHGHFRSVPGPRPGLSGGGTPRREDPSRQCGSLR